MIEHQGTSSDFRSFVIELVDHRLSFQREPDSLAHLLVSKCEIIGKISVKSYVHNFQTTPIPTLQSTIYPQEVERRANIDEVKIALDELKNRVMKGNLRLPSIEEAFLRYIFSVQTEESVQIFKKPQIPSEFAPESMLPGVVRFLRPLNVALMLTGVGYFFWKSLISLEFQITQTQIINSIMTIGFLVIIILFIRFVKSTILVVPLTLLLLGIMAFIGWGEYSFLMKVNRITKGIRLTEVRFTDIETVLAFYKQIHQKYPNGLHDLVTPVEYLEKKSPEDQPLSDPFKKKFLMFDYISNKDSYVLRSWGPDGMLNVNLEKDFDWVNNIIRPRAQKLMYDAKNGIDSEGDIILYSRNWKFEK